MENQAEASSSPAGGQTQGQRSYQEDAWKIVALSSSDWLLLLADGMGGHAGGADASAMCIAEFEAAFKAEAAGDGIGDVLVNCLTRANDAIAAAQQADPKLSEMGCTLIAAYATSSKLFWLSVGDSPLWLVRGGSLSRINADHSLAPVLDRLADEGEITREEALEGRRSALRSAVQGDEIPLIDVTEEGERLKTGDILILASDGMETLDHETVVSIVTRSDLSSAGKAAALTEAVDAAGKERQDNATVIVYELGPTATGAGAALAQPVANAAPGQPRPTPEAQEQSAAAPKRSLVPWIFITLVSVMLVAGGMLSAYMMMNGGANEDSASTSPDNQQ